MHVGAWQEFSNTPRILLATSLSFAGQTVALTINAIV